MLGNPPGGGMSTIKAVLEEELGRLKKLRLRYTKEIAALPEGSLSIKNRNGREYAYRAYRKNARVITDYIGPADTEDVKTLREQIAQRKKFEQLLKKTKIQVVEIEKSLHGKKI